MGLVALALLAVAVGLGLVWRMPTRNRGWALPVAALLLGAAGYIGQGRPFLPGQPGRAGAARPPAEPLFAMEREIWLGKVGADADLLAGADRLIARGDADYAVGILRGAVARSPADMAAWLGLGNALAAYADGAVTPASRFAFARASAIAPRHPAPPYFLGLAYAASGDLDAAARVWRALLAATPADAPYRRLIETRLAMVAGPGDRGMPRGG